MPASERFGALVTRADVTQAATTTLQAWLPTWLAELERRYNKPARWIPVPDQRSYRTIAEGGALVKFPEEALPAVFVVSPGLVGTPNREGIDGDLVRDLWTAPFALTVAVIAGARDQEETDFLIDLYVAAVCGVLLANKAPLNGVVREVQWADESYVTRHVEERTRGMGEATFVLDVPRARTSGPGPTTPDDPYVAPSDFPVIESVEIDANPNPNPRGST